MFCGPGTKASDARAARSARAMQLWSPVWRKRCKYSEPSRFCAEVSPGSARTRASKKAMELRTSGSSEGRGLAGGICEGHARPDTVRAKRTTARKPVDNRCGWYFISIKPRRRDALLQIPFALRSARRLSPASQPLPCSRQITPIPRTPGSTGRRNRRRLRLRGSGGSLPGRPDPDLRGIHRSGREQQFRHIRSQCPVPIPDREHRRREAGRVHRRLLRCSQAARLPRWPRSRCPTAE